jgi:tetraacyldisaccharide 4'-kinase
MHQPKFWWYPQLSMLALVLSPLSWVYGAVAVWQGNRRAKRAYYAGVPVVAVGNLSVGGSGKTPLVQALARYYANQGHQVAIIMRGYGGAESGQPVQVRTEFTAAQVGDEAAMLARASAHLPIAVWVGAHRPSVVRRAEQAGATLMILDDAFQRRDVARDVNILVLDGSRPWPFGNELVVPAGPLREPLSARQRASFAVLMDAPQPSSAEAPPYYGVLTYRLHKHLSAPAVKRLQGQRVLAFCGLGHPEKFFAALKQAGLSVAAAVRYPDHYPYPTKSLAYLQRQAKAHGLVLVTTEKDAIKLPVNFAHHIPLEINTDAEWQNVLAAIDAALTEQKPAP